MGATKETKRITAMDQAHNVAIPDSIYAEQNSHEGESEREQAPLKKRANRIAMKYLKRRKKVKRK